MKTIVDSNSGKVLFATSEEITLLENQTAIDEMVTEFFVKAHFNFESRLFFEGATQEEIDFFNQTETE
jgi:hypothetical protein